MTNIIHVFKMIKLVKLSIIISIITIITGCSYEFSSDNFIDIVQPEKTDNIIDLNNFKNLDIINVTSQLSYTFLGKKNQRLTESLLFIDGKKYGIAMNDNIGSFRLIPEMYEDGIHTITIISKYTSGSGSIADQNQTEILTSTKEIQFVVHRKPSNPPQITEASIKDGSIIVKWTAVNNPDYINAYLSLKFKTKEIRIPLTKEILDLGYYTDKNTILFSGNSNTPDYDEYLAVTYSIVFASPYTEVYSTSKTIRYEPSWLKIKISYNNDVSYKIKWASYPLYANIKDLEIRQGINTIFGASTGGEYTVNTPYKIGKDYATSVQPRSETAQYSIPSFSNYDTDLDEDTFGLFTFKSLFSKDILYNPSTNKYYALIIEKNSQNIFQIYIYEYTDKMIFIKKAFIAEFNYQRHEVIKLQLDPIDKNFYIDASNSTYKIDKLNLSILKSHSIPSYSGLASLRNNILSNLQTSNSTLSLSDLQNNTLIYSGNFINQSYLSRDGKYVCILTESSHTVYKINSNQLIKVMDILPSRNIEIEKDFLYYSNGYEIYIVDLVSKTTKNFTANWTDPNIKLDYSSNKILSYQNGQGQIYDLSTKKTTLFSYETTKNTTGEFADVDREYTINLQNDKLIHSKGIYININ